MADKNIFIGFSIVLAAKSNNPTILNPDFLRYPEPVARFLSGLEIIGNNRFWPSPNG